MYQPEKLKQKREELGLEQQELAERIGVSKQAYFKWEKGLSKPTKANIAKLEKVLKVPEGYLSEDEISSLYKQLTEPNQEKAITYVRDLVSSQKVISIAEKRSEYHVYEKLSAGIGASVYGDLDYDVVYYNEELPHDFASWVDGNSMEPTYQNGEVALIRETIMTGQFMQSFGIHRLISKKSIVKKKGSAWYQSIRTTLISLHHLMRIHESSERLLVTSCHWRTRYGLL